MPNNLIGRDKELSRYHAALQPVSNKGSMRYTHTAFLVKQGPVTRNKLGLCGQGQSQPDRVTMTQRQYPSTAWTTYCAGTSDHDTTC